MIEIIPAIMPRGMLDLHEKCERMVGHFPMVQIDVCDGVFVPNKTWPYLEGRGAFDKIIRGEEPLPFWDKLDYEIDLMIGNAERDLSNWTAAGAARLIVHVESTHHLDDVIRHFGKRRTDESASGPTPPELVLAINIATQNELVEPYMDDIHGVQFMGIADIGAQGNPFDDRVLPKISALRAKYPDAVISVDGGMTFESAPLVIHAGANRIVSGSTILSTSDIEEAKRKLMGN